MRLARTLILAAAIPAPLLAQIRASEPASMSRTVDGLAEARCR